MGLERTGIVEEGQRRLAAYSRHAPSARTVDGPLPDIVADAVDVGMAIVVDEVAAAVVRQLPGQIENVSLPGLIRDTVERYVRERLALVAAARLKRASERLDDLPPDARLPIKAIVAIVTDVTGITVSEITGPRRIPRIAEARHFAYWLIRRVRPDMSALQIARAFSRFDHGAVLLAVRKVEMRRLAEPYSIWLTAPAVVALLDRGVK
jgi:chromosomal replication initiation ATPase DnaA